MADAKVITAVIMAAGMGTRFGDMTSLIPKGFVEVNGIPMIIRSIETLIECGIQKIIIGTGYHSQRYEDLMRIYPQVECCFSEQYATTNSMWTLYNCAPAIGMQDFILLESDLVFEKRAIELLLSHKQESILLAADETKFQDQYFVEYDSTNLLVNCSTQRQSLKVCGEFVGIHKISALFYEKLCQYYQTIMKSQPKLGYEYGLLYIAQNQLPLFVLKVPNLKWYEIDDVNDLKFAEKLLFV